MRPLVAGLAIAFSAVSPWVMAGLGGLRQLAAPGEPFYAEVVLEPEPGLENPFVTLAPRERYASLAPYSDKATQLQVRTVEVAPQQYMVRIAGPVLAPGEALNFALELSWPSGKVVREYRVSGGQPLPLPAGKKDDSSAALGERHPLIDEPGMPAFGEGRLLSARGLPMRAEVELLGDWPAALAAASFSLHQPSDEALAGARFTIHQRKGRHWLSIRTDAPLQQARVMFELQARHHDEVIQRGFTFIVPQRGAFVAKQVQRSDLPLAGQYRVRPGDTLFGLARHFARGRPLNQVADQLFAANPAAFHQGNRDRLFAGAVLQVPTETAAPVTASAPLATPAPELAAPAAAVAAAASEPLAQAPQAASAPAAALSAEEISKLAQLKAAQQRLAWLEAEIGRLSAQPQRLTLMRREEEASQAAEDAGFLDDNLTRWVLYGTGGLSVGSLLVWLLLKRRRQAAASAVPPARNDMAPFTISATLGPDRQPLAEPIVDDISLQNIDVLAEADVLMAYGRFDAAEQLLRESMASEPAREDLRLKLLDLVARKGNREEFEAIALDMLALFGPHSGLWKRVQQQGFALDPANPLYRPTPEPQAAFALQGAGQALSATPATLREPEPEPAVVLSSQADGPQAAQELAKLYREMGDSETADALLRDAGIQS